VQTRATSAHTAKHPVHDLADRFVDAYADASPLTATFAGIAGHDDRWGDLSPTGVGHLHDLVRRTRAELAALPPATDRWDELGVRTLSEHLDVELLDHEHGEPELDLAHLGSTIPTMREVLEAQSTTTEADREALVRRLETYGEALAGWQATMDAGRRRGLVVARRQVASVADQVRSAVSDRGSLTRLARALARGNPVLAARLDRALAGMRIASDEVADWLERVYLPDATERDGVGPDRYLRLAHRELRTTVDPVEASAWGWERIHTLWDRAERTARELDPDASLAEVMTRLKEDPAFAAPSPAAFRDLMQARLRHALTSLDGTHFHVPEAIREVEVHLVAPGAPLGAWYIGPSEDFSRPGTVWWSLGDREMIPLYEEVSTAYHEGFPGHHLQIGVQVSLAEHLTRAHRLLIWNPGYGEGWALYAEQLMDELGLLERPEYVLGYLTSCLLRAVRVVVDIGLHLDLPIPDHAPVNPGGRWSFEVGVEALERLAFLDRPYAVSEVTRYLGMPAQAISYAIGAQRIVELREERRRLDGSAFDLARFHADVLGSGPVGLDHLTELVLVGGGGTPG
jgi:uncharacterized protein (DUF885 family)